MIRSLDFLTIWLGDFYLLSTVILAMTLAVGMTLRQPAKRLAVIKATLVALAILAALCALPRWSVVHLRTAPQASATSNATPQAAAFAAASTPVGDTKWPTNNDTAPFPLAKPASDAETASAVWKEIRWQRGFVVTYIAGAAGVFAWLVIGQLGAIRLRRQAQPALAELTAMLEEVATRGRVSPRLGFNEHEKTTKKVGHFSTTTPPTASFKETDPRNPELLISPRVAAPVALGILQPTIILPKSWLSQLPLPDREGLGEGSAALSAKAPSPFPLPKGEGLDSTAHLRSILAHELAHIRNHDLAWLAVSRVLLVLLWAQPLFWLVRRQMRFDQETLADAAAAELTSRQHYAEQLVAWARSLATRPLPMRLSPAVGLWEGASQLRQRVAMLLNANFSLLRVCSRGWRNSVAGIAVLTTVGLSSITLQPTTRAEEAPEPLAQATPAVSPKPPSERPATSATRPEPNSIIGRAVDEKKQPLADAEVFLFRVNNVASTRNLVAQKRTDANGEFRFDHVFDIAKEFPDGKIVFDDPNEQEYLQTVVRAPGRVTYIRTLFRQIIARFGRYGNVELPPAAKLSGRVSARDGTPVTGALVCDRHAGMVPWEGAAAARTNIDGYYELNDVAPFDKEDIRTQREAFERRLTKSLRGTPYTADSVLFASPLITVNHPDFAVKTAGIDHIPGTQDVMLEPAAIIEGKVVFGDTLRPAAGAVVRASTTRPQATRLTEDQVMSLHHAVVQTDASGNYRITTLPAGNYELLAEMPNWVNVGFGDLAAESGKTTVAPDLILTKGGLVSVRLIDGQTGAALKLRPNISAGISSQRYPLQPIVGRTVWDPNVTPNSDGRFVLRSPPGKRAIIVTNVKIGDELKWVAKVSIGELKPSAVVDVQEGQTVQIDVPVVDEKELESGGVNGTFQPSPR